ncbi:conserved hypothetical protein [Vibrio nigripulchritudo MADA3029]|uniref:hypothetical protein n=1 Tax=Vibrio nigripulchritudo TaxID=28173 RepID=UPI0003B1CDE7|nr:hypothetical protein [Vibrio nigripulchritudo]CCN50861.1 conserved hypothetical protein [Vibrio nigripulchritudo MADA3020]CCN56719.1 conserved hypothetical protein [Vibrio nigripulchritudo MADA3021]CCN62576.1 conserved hypothetical protein [Vibrio nigripulchritudo MADA3029]
MDKKTKGSWLIHHTNKIQGVSNVRGYKSTVTAGKAGLLLSAISASNDELNVNRERVEVLAESVGVNELELDSLLTLLKNKDLVDFVDTEVVVLGVTTEKALEHTADIFDSRAPTAKEEASLSLSELASEKPQTGEFIIDTLSSKFEVSQGDIQDAVHQAETIGFTDTEKISAKETLYFNGNLFRKDNTLKISKILESLSSADQSRLIELNNLLDKNACVPVDLAKRILTEPLYNKTIPIGLYDLNVVSNSQEDAGYITKPSAFSKFNSSAVDDAFDLVKAFVCSLTYGMTRSGHERGQITWIERLLEVLVNGDCVGPAPAIAQDYKILEHKNVVQVYQGYNKGRYGWLMRLLKKEVGELALAAIKTGNITEHSLDVLPSAKISSYKKPEIMREISRKKDVEESQKETHDMLMVLRTNKVVG